MMTLQDLHERMRSGQLYYCDDEDLIMEQKQYLEILYDFNHTRPMEDEKRQQLLKRLFAEIGDSCYVEPPLHANWGKNTHFGNGVVTNFNLTLVDDVDVYIGNHVMIGPNVTIDTGTHPIRPDIRKKQAQYNLPVHIGDNVWLGAGVIVLPGVTIGENTVVGAGSVVTKDLPANVVAVGVPCRVLREISDNDYRYYDQNREIDID